MYNLAFSQFLFRCKDGYIVGETQNILLSYKTAYKITSSTSFTTRSADSRAPCTVP